MDAAGNVGIVAISSTATTDLSILLWTHRKSDPPNTLNGPTTIIAGTKPYTCEPDRAFASIANPSGVDTMLWHGSFGRHEVMDHRALGERDAGRCVWNTRIVEYQIAPRKQSKAKNK